MSYNGAGVWTANSAGQPVVTGTTITSTAFNTFTADVATGLSNAICKDGQTTVTANIPMAGFKFTGLGLGTAATDAASVANANTLACEFRLTLVSVTPVTTSDVTGATTIYCTPYKGNHIALFDGSNWNMRTSAEFSIALGTLTSGKPYDVFCYDNATVPTLEILAWTNDATRTTALVLQNGVLVKSGATTRRYLGTFYTTSTTTTEDSNAKRFLWNYYNRIRRSMRVLTTGSWTYNSATIRQANASATNQLDFVIGYSEDVVNTSTRMLYSNSTNAGIYVSTGIGQDNTTTYTTGCILGGVSSVVASGSVYQVSASSLSIFPSVGRHYLAMLEAGSATGTNTFVSQVSADQVGGIQGDLLG